MIVSVMANLWLPSMPTIQTTGHLWRDETHFTSGEKCVSGLSGESVSLVGCPKTWWSKRRVICITETNRYTSGVLCPPNPIWLSIQENCYFQLELITDIWSTDGFTSSQTLTHKSSLFVDYPLMPTISDGRATKSIACLIHKRQILVKELTVSMTSQDIWRLYLFRRENEGNEDNVHWVLNSTTALSLALTVAVVDKTVLFISSHDIHF